MTPPAVHAGCLIVGTCGILIRGAAGSGKSSLADTLIETAKARGGLGRLVADDYVHLQAEDGRLLATVPDTIRGGIEIRGFGLAGTLHERRAHVRLVVELVPPDRIERLPDEPLARENLNGVRLPVLRCPENDPGNSLRLIRWALRRLLPGSPDYI
jgi:HPr kinase/phosphorylase